MCGKILVKKSKKGRNFLDASNYPECKFVSWYEPVKEKCPKCNSYMVKNISKQKENIYNVQIQNVNIKEYKRRK